MMEFKQQPCQRSSNDCSTDSEICLIANPDVITRDEPDRSTLLFEPASGRILKLNPVGLAIWKMMDGTRTLEEVVHAIQKLFSDVSESVDLETRSFIEDLFLNGYIGKIIREH